MDFPRGQYANGVYQAPSLFPDFARHRSYAARRLYCEQVLCALAEAKALRLTDILTQPEAIQNVCGDVILGRNIEGDGRYTSGEMDIPEVLQAYRVIVATLPNKTEKYVDEYDNEQMRPLTVHYVDGSKSGPDQILRSKSLAQQEVGGFRVATLVDRLTETNKQEVTLSLRAAWFCLKAHGQFVAFGATARDRGRNWLYRELDKPVEQPPRTKQRETESRV